MIKKLILLISYIFSFISCSFAEIPIKFFREEINITLKKSSVQVHGLYFFENKSNLEVYIRLFYPFPIDSSHFYPENVRVLDPKSPIDFISKKDRIVWSLHFEPYGVETTYVEYTQRIEEKNATYILTTTKLWKEKIDKAMFIIESPLEFNELNVSIKPDSGIIKRNKRIYYITRSNFLPDTDLKITWK